MIAVTYRITLLEPLLATALDGDPNSAISHLYIPGSMIRGYLAGRLIDPADDAAISQRDPLFDGQTRFLNAYPATEQGGRLLPVPRSLYKPKEQARNRYPDRGRQNLPAAEGDDLLPEGYVEDRAILAEEDWEIKKPLQIPGFVLIEAADSEAVLHIPSRQITIHTQRDPKAGRAKTGSGAVYRYEALEKGQSFIGAVVVPNQQTAAKIVTGLNPQIAHMGRAATAGYGRVEFSQVKIEANWRECEMAVDDLPAHQDLVITLLSDTILRNHKGQPHTDLCCALAEEYQLTFEVVRAFKSVHYVGAFNRKWGLPLPQSLALVAGSVFVVRCADPIPTATLQTIAERGIGQQRIDGFGRLAINWQQEETLREREYRTSRDYSQPKLESDSRSVQMAQLMAMRRRRQDLDKALVEAVAKLPIQHAPPNSQLSRLRTITRNALDEQTLRKICDLLTPDNANALKSGALRKFEAARINRVPLSRWIRELAEKPENVRQYFSKAGQAVTLGGIEPPAKLEIEYAARLIDGVLAQAMDMRARDGANRKQQTEEQAHDRSKI